MCYRCEFCKNVVPAGVSRRVYVEQRLRPSRKLKTKFSFDAKGEISTYAEEVPSVYREIAKEVPVCLTCYLWLTLEGVTPAELLRHLEMKRRQQDRAMHVTGLPSRRFRLAPPLPCGDSEDGAA